MYEAGITNGITSEQADHIARTIIATYRQERTILLNAMDKPVLGRHIDSYLSLSPIDKHLISEISHAIYTQRQSI